MRIENDIKLDFDDVLIRPKRSKISSRKDVDLRREFIFLNSGNKFYGVPIIAANMDTIGTFLMARKLVEKLLMVALHKYYTEDQYIAFYNESSTYSSYDKSCFYSIGILENDLEKFNYIKTTLSKSNNFPVCIDVANGYTENFVDFIKKFRNDNPDRTIMAGNVCTAEMTEQLILSGADIVKVGIGGGLACTTRKVTGVGVPQLSAVIECADAAHGLGGLICSDGGCTTSGDISKAFGAGADFVMLGGMLAGHTECEVVFKDGKMTFYGMSSNVAMNKYHGGKAEYKASEGNTVMIDFKGNVDKTIKEILGGIRSACTYVGARKLKELSKRTTFIKVNHNG